jgi:ketosteroid isomerase-like protein
MEGATSFEEARAVVEAAGEALNRADLEAFEALLADDVEYVMRDGVDHGPQSVVDFWRPQFERFKVELAPERIIDAGDGTVLVLQTVTRRNLQTGEVELRAWPAAVFRVREGKIVFLEGYGDRRKAFTDLGLEPE